MNISYHNTKIMRSILAAALLLAAAVSCDRNDRLPGGAQVSFRLVSGEMQQGAEAGIYAFSPGDGVSVPDLKYENVPYLFSGDSFKPSVEGNAISVSEGENLCYVAYSPYKESSAEDGIDGYLYHVDLTDQYSAVLNGLLWGRTESGSSADVSIEMSCMLSLVDISVSLAPGVRASDVEDMEIRFEGLYNQGILSLLDGSMYNTGMPSTIVPVEDGEGGYMAVVMPSSSNDYAGRSVVVTLPAIGKEFVWDFPEDYVFEQGMAHKVDVYVDVDGINVTTGAIADWNGTDSNPDVVTDDSGYMSLPNSYIVKPGSEFSIPVAKAYAMWHNDPLLSGSGESIPDNLRAEIIWQERFETNTSLLIASNENVRIQGSGIDAVINVKLNDGVEGNLCIGVKDEYDCWWSWHIWVTDYDPEDPSSQYEMNGQVFMTRNLGAISDVAGPQSQGMYYQWGRKDAFPGSYTWRQFESGNVGWCNTGIGQITMAKSMDGSSVESDNMSASVKNPFKTIKYASYDLRDWLSAVENAVPYRWSDEDGAKAVYDPCPEGWRVPVSGAGQSSVWYGMQDMWSWSDDAQGLVDESGAYLPAGGFIDPGMPSGDEVAAGGYLWSASSAGKGAYALRYSASGISTAYQGDKNLAMPVRCVKD